ncbi:DUF3466 family protein [Alteromonas sp. 1_MG-2023]|uniref:DUF3466 family protein n=1 Tax=Alteromonas sp. 1_MG-2023 TaxID=3062669 RepID=UPI0026E32845|nr:DUF3466 family protein [Alteromonas sp. 1_MG-2023]MDO6565874.1 DUF3466 family protein [Alteromonas sp. 1_MG-2023]
MKRTQLAVAVLLATGSVSATAATYTVTPLPLQDVAENNYARSIDDTGKMLSVVETEFSPPIDLDQLEDDTSFYTTYSGAFEDESDALQGEFTDADYTLVVSYLYSIQTASTGQKLATYRTYSTDTSDIDLVPGLDEVTDKFDDYTQSVEAIGRDSVGGNFIVGDSPGVVILDEYEDEDGETVNYTYSELPPQAFAQTSSGTKILPPVDDTLGGFASARAVNRNLQVAGFSTVEFLDTVEDAMEDCEEEETRGDIPEGRCLYSIYAGEFNVPRISSYFVTNSTSYLSSFILSSEVNATIWQLDVNGDVISTDTFPLLFTPEPDDTVHYFSYAYDINEQGIAVGEALTGDAVNITRPNSSGLNESERVATVFRDGETEEILPREENLISQAIAINDNNWVAGAVLRESSDIARSRLFAYNLDTTEQLYPDGFFTTAAVQPNAINNNNIIVGKSDYDATSDTIRENHAFMFNIETEEFTDLNDLIECDSDYLLVEAIDINDNNEIIANARIRSTSKYITGVEIINSEGETNEVDSIVAVKLTPSAGSIDDCSTDDGDDSDDSSDDDDEENYERKGASTGFFGLVTLCLMTIFRRKMKK